MFSYEGLPDSLKKECFVRSKVDGDPDDEVKARQELVKSMTPLQLGQIRGLSDFPLPKQLDSLVRPSKRNLKSTKAKELQKRRYVWSARQPYQSGNMVADFQ